MAGSEALPGKQQRTRLAYTNAVQMDKTRRAERDLYGKQADRSGRNELHLRQLQAYRCYAFIYMSEGAQQVSRLSAPTFMVSAQRPHQP